MRRLALTGLLGLTLLLLQPWSTTATGQPGARPPDHQHGVHTVARGLDNPRGLAVLSDGRLFVAEAGHAGPVCLGPGMCVGMNGAITAIDTHSGRRTTLADGLPSLGGPFGTFGLGGVALDGHGLAFVTGLYPQAFGRPSAACKGQKRQAACVRTIGALKASVGLLARVGSLSSNAGWHRLAAVGRFDFAYAAAHPDPGNPEYMPGDANPFGVTAGPGGGHYVVDAASNTLDLFTRTGGVRVLAFVPDPPGHRPIYDAAPTCAARTPGGDLYIGTESSSLYRWDGTRLTLALRGGKIGQVVGCVADDHGNVYLANLSSRIRGSFPDFHEKPFDGSVVKVTPDLETSFVATRLNLPAGLTIDPSGRDLYVAVNGLCPTDLSLLTSKNAPAGACPKPGKVVRIRLHH